MTREELREKVASVVAYGDGLSPVLDHHRRTADAAIALIRAETLEEAAKVAADYQHPNMALYNHQTGISAAILALIPSDGK